MTECDECGKEFETLEDWGQYKFCEGCIQDITNRFGERTEKENSEIEFKFPLTRGAAYHPETGNTIIYEMRESDTFLCLNHEYVHFLLHGLIGLRCCYQFDNVDKPVDDYHSLE